jgi:PadR family transcriptional regulator, regulatory protein PadR
VTESNEVQLKRGVLELCVLALLARGDNYAYEIATRLASEIGMGEGTIYPLMRRMQADGLLEDYLVESSSGPPRRYYRLSRAGRASLSAQRKTWETFSRAIDRLLKGSPARSRLAALGRVK